MSARDLNSVVQAPGRLCINPTSLGLQQAFPHGGTELGVVRDAYLEDFTATWNVSAEEYGGETVDSVWTGTNYAFGCLLRSFDDTALQTVFPNTVVGTYTRRRGVYHPQKTGQTAVREGHLLSSRSVVLLFSPLDSVRNRAVLFYRALPKVLVNHRIQLGFRDRAEVGVVFEAIRDTSGRGVAVEFLKELTL